MFLLTLRVSSYPVHPALRLGNTLTILTISRQSVSDMAVSQSTTNYSASNNQDLRTGPSQHVPQNTSIMPGQSPWAEPFELSDAEASTPNISHEPSLSPESFGEPSFLVHLSGLGIDTAPFNPPEASIETGSSAARRSRSRRPKRRHKLNKVAMPVLYSDASPANVAKIVVPMETAHTMPRARGRIGKDGVLRNDILYWSQLWKEIKDEEEDLGKLPVEELPFE